MKGTIFNSLRFDTKRGLVPVSRMDESIIESTKRYIFRDPVYIRGSENSTQNETFKCSSTFFSILTQKNYLSVASKKHSIEIQHSKHSRIVKLNTCILQRTVVKFL